MSRRKTTCEGCGCNCKNCSDSVGGSLHLHVEIENLKQRLLERENHIVSMETNFLREAEKFPNGEMAALTEELLTWQDKYSRLYESHKRVQKVNQNLEDKLLKIVDKCETEKNILTAEVAALTRRLVDEKFNVSKLQEENERYRNDVNLAIQLLQCKPSNFVPQKYDSLPCDLQQKVRSYVTSKRRISVSDIQQKQPEMKTIKVPIPTFPPTAMVYSVNKTTTDKDGSSGNGNSGNGDEKNSRQGGTVDIVSAAIMAKVLEERERERSQMKHCETCTCPSNAANTDNGGNTKRHHKETQTSGSLLVINNESDVKETGSSFNNVCSSPMSVRHNNNNNNLFNNNSNVIRNFVGSGPNLNSSSNFVSGMLDRNNKLKDNNNKSQIDYFGDDFNTPSSASVAIGIIPSLVESVDSSNYNRPNNCKDDKPLSSSDIEINIGDITSSSSNSSSNSNSNTNLLLADTDCKNSSRHNSNENCLSLFDGNMHSDATENLIIFDNKSPTNSTSLTVTTASTSIISPSVTTSLANNFNVNNCTNLGKPIGGTIRHCSVRLQAGTSNILLDNVVDGPYAPVLYKSRQQSTDPLLVHGSSSHRSVSNSCCNDDQRLLLLSNDTTNVIPPSNSMSPSLPSYNLSSNSSNSSLSSSSTVSSSNLSTNSSLSSFNLQHQQRKNFNLAQIRTETEI